MRLDTKHNEHWSAELTNPLKKNDAAQHCKIKNNQFSDVYLSIRRVKNVIVYMCIRWQQALHVRKSCYSPDDN